MSVRRAWAPVLLVVLVLLSGMLVGSAGESGAAQPRLTVSSIMIPAAAFVPTRNTFDYQNLGVALSMISGDGYFTFPVSFPAAVVDIRRITLYAYDNDAGQVVSAALYRDYPPGAEVALLGSVSTSGASTAAPTVVATTAISPRRISTAAHGAYLWVYLSGPAVTLYGVKVAYEIVG